MLRPILKVSLVVVMVASLLTVRRLDAQERQATEPQPPAVMDNQQLEKLLERYFDGHQVEGRLGFWRIALTEDLAEDAEEEPDAEQAPKEEDALEEDPHKGPGAGDRLPAVVLVITDERADRMRIMMPIRPFNPKRPEDLQLALIALHANYDRALDARYAIQEGVLWSVFIHPLGSLTPANLTNALDQVKTLRDNTGTTYSSSDLLFGGDGEQEEEAEEQEVDPKGVI